MQNFTYHNPTMIVFGKGTISKLPQLISSEVDGKNAKVLLTFGGGSIKANGVYAQVMEALAGFDVIEFGGIEPNPRYATCMRAVHLCREQGVDFLLAVGGGSVLDATKFIAAAARFTGEDPWELARGRTEATDAIALGTVLTLPATGSESNTFAVVSRDDTQEKLGFGAPCMRPRFAVLDPTTTFSLPTRQTINGIVDAYVHVLEQYLTYPADAPLQDRQAEAILLTLLEEGPKVLAEPNAYAARANVMWAATQALNGLIGCGVPQDWATHLLGHEMTVLWGLDHAQSLAVGLAPVLTHQRAQKRHKLLQYGERVFGLSSGSEDERITAAIARTQAFFHALGMKTSPADYAMPKDAFTVIAERLNRRGLTLGEWRDLGYAQVAALGSIAAHGAR